MRLTQQETKTLAECDEIYSFFLNYRKNNNCTVEKVIEVINKKYPAQGFQLWYFIIWLKYSTQQFGNPKYSTHAHKLFLIWSRINTVSKLASEAHDKMSKSKAAGSASKDVLTKSAEAHGRSEFAAKFYTLQALKLKLISEAGQVEYYNMCFSFLLKEYKVNDEEITKNIDRITVEDNADKSRDVQEIFRWIQNAGGSNYSEDDFDQVITPQPLSNIVKDH